MNKFIAEKIYQYKMMTKDEKKELAKNVAITTGAFTAGIVIGKAVKRARVTNRALEEKEMEVEELENEIDHLGDLLEELERANTINVRKINSKAIVDLTKAECEIADRDIMLMEEFDGSKNRYRAARQAMWDVPERMGDELERQTSSAWNAWNSWKNIKDRPF